MLAHDLHLFAVGLVGGEETDLFEQRGACAATCGCFAQGNADGFGVAHSGGPDDIERVCGAVVETDMERAGHTPTVARLVLHDWLS